MWPWNGSDWPWTGPDDIDETEGGNSAESCKRQTLVLYSHLWLLTRYLEIYMYTEMKVTVYYSMLVPITWNLQYIHYLQSRVPLMDWTLETLFHCPLSGLLWCARQRRSAWYFVNIRSRVSSMTMGVGSPIDAVSKPGYCSSYSWEVFTDEVFIISRSPLPKIVFAWNLYNYSNYQNLLMQLQL